MVGRDLLNPAAGSRPAERADAGRNRQRVLAAAARLFAERDPRTVTMDDVAKQAGVGRATLYRRYPSIGAIAEALLDQHERELQELIISGPPPLGPGAAPPDRLVAFYAAMVQLLHSHAALVLASEVGQARFETGAYRFWRLHLRHLTRAAGVADPEVVAELLLAPLAPEVFLETRRFGASLRAIERSLTQFARALTAAGPEA
ncbi:TetR/AcrR family transcriptional regulator [Microlunatus speluncae]|uniref:TetR/AcrR family transcriptional regulator n=1 Tax=Microlunatus speluncae TaxID=2594267 RepID=UPI00158407E7|nr:TetR/AcrR family transcriptional regulator [Microlunatus speluncae]